MTSNIHILQAVNALVYWAVLTNRPKLAKILWKKTDDPIALALIVSMILHKLSGHCRDQDLRNTISRNAE